MEPKSQHSRVYSESDKNVYQPTEGKRLSIRKKLLDTNLQKDSNLITSKKRPSTKSSERLQSIPITSTQGSSSQYHRGLVLRDYNPVPEVLNKLKSKSPSIHKRTFSSEGIPQLGIKLEAGRNRKRTEKPTDRIMSIAENFSVKKVIELGKLSANSDFYLCRAFIALLCEVDYHIKESQNYPIEVFFEYLTSPGIVVQTIKKIPNFLTADKIQAQSFTKSLEFFNQITDISPNPSLELLADLLQSIYTYKGLQFKPQTWQDSGRISTRAYQTPREDGFNFGEYLKITSKTPAGAGKESMNGNSNYKIKVLNDIRPGDDFMHSKTVLLDKFFEKMGLSQAEMTQRRVSPPKEYRNRSQDYLEKYSDSKFYIKPVKDTRASSLTPKSSDLKSGLPQDFSSSKNLKKVGKPEKGKNSQVGVSGSILRKIEEKFVQILSEKLKKETLDVKKLKKSNFNEYVKKKNFYISANKVKWISDTIKFLENSDLLLKAQENDVGKGTKQEALNIYLNDETRLASLIKKAELIELASRKSKKQ